MNLAEEYRLSEYRDLGMLDGNDKVHIVRNGINGMICVRKVLAPELMDIYQFLMCQTRFQSDFSEPRSGLPQRIIALWMVENLKFHVNTMSQRQSRMIYLFLRLNTAVKMKL